MRKTSHPFSRRIGFTLVEVLATLVLVGVVLPVAMRGITLSMQVAQKSKRMIEAGQLAEQKINEFLVVRDAAYFTGTGDFGQEWPDYRWESHGSYRDQSTYDVSVIVYWNERNQPRSITLSTIIYPNNTLSTEAATDSADAGGTP